MTRIRWDATAFLVSACLLVAGLAEGKAAGGAATTADPVPALLKSAPDVARGRALFTGTCGAYCHQMTPTGSDAPYLFDCDWLHGGSDQQIFHSIAQGVPNTRMVAFGGAIPDTDLWRIVAYLKSASTCKS